MFPFQIGAPEETKLHILIIGSFFDTSPLGRELTVDLAKHVLYGHSLQEPPMIRLLKNVVLHFMPFTENFNAVLNQFNSNNTICDPQTVEEFADHLLSPENDHKKLLFLKWLETERFDLAFTFSAGGFELQHPSVENPNSIYVKSAFKIIESRFRETHNECALNPLRIHQTNTLQKITQFLLESYRLPLYSIQLDCCKMPTNKEIANIWRRNIHKVLNFLKLTETGVKGSVRNAENVPLRKSTISIVDHNLSISVTKNLAYFRFVLPAGQYELKINSSEAGIQTVPVNLGENQVVDLGNIQLQQQKLDDYKVGVGKGDVTPIHGGVVSGLILNDKNQPIANALIAIIDSKHQVMNTSDRMGRYHLRGTPFGTNTLKVEAYGHSTATR